MEKDPVKEVQLLRFKEQNLRKLGHGFAVYFLEE